MIHPYGMFHTKNRLAPQSSVGYPGAMNVQHKTRGNGAPQPRANRRHWSELATAARPQLEGLRFGERELALRRVADHHGVNPQTLRRALAALRFIEILESQRFLKKLGLRAAPMAAIEHVARWHAYDRAAALHAARLLADGRYTVAALGAAEATARIAARASGVGRSLIHRCRARVGPVLRSQFKACDIDERAGRRRDEPSVDFRFRPAGCERWTIAAIIMGPYRDRSRYELRLGDWIVKALGLCAIYERVILVVPTAAIKKRCIAWLETNGIRSTAFELQVVTPEP
jgi:hypothetical protein